MSGADGDDGPGDDSGSRTVLVDASVFITLAAVGSVDLLDGLEGEVVVPDRVANELTDDRSRAALANARERGSVRVVPAEDRLDNARSYLGAADGDTGDVGLLAHALGAEEEVVAVADDRPLRKACKALSIPVSGSIGVLVRAVERGAISGEEATETLYAMDEVGARLSASLIRRAERLIEDAASD